MADITAFGATDDVAFARHLVREIGVATVPGSSFFHDKDLGRRLHPLLLLQAGRDARRGDRAAAEAEGGCVMAATLIPHGREPRLRDLG